MPTMNQPRFSIVIPCYNESAYIANSLKSLKLQDFSEEYEIIVVDNNSTDDTAAKAKKLGARVIKQKQAGVCWARQKGTEEAIGEIIISTDADSTFSSDWLSSIDQIFKSDPKIVCVTGPFHYNGGPFWGAYAKYLFKLINIYYQLTGHVTYSPGTNLAFKKSVWDGYNTLMTQYGDELDLLRKLKQKGKVVFSGDLVVKTSPRRLRHGFIYNVVISLFVYSLLEYNLNRLFKRRFFGQAPAFRDE